MSGDLPPKVRARVPEKQGLKQGLEAEIRAEISRSGREFQKNKD